MDDEKAKAGQEDETGIVLGMPVEEVQIALFVFAFACIGLAVYLVIKGSTHG